jgi:hypothetical protein
MLNVTLQLWKLLPLVALLHPGWALTLELEISGVLPTNELTSMRIHNFVITFYNNRNNI